MDEVPVGAAVLVVIWGLRRWATHRRSGRLHVSQDTIARLRRTRDEGGQRQQRSIVKRVRTIVYGILTVGVLAMYVLGLIGVGRLFPAADDQGLA